LEYNQAHKPFSFSITLLIYVRHKFWIFSTGVVYRCEILDCSIHLSLMVFVTQVMWCEPA
jgi:hypothetical protein